ncbi:MAG TPA: DUF3780 domain-containing protein [Pirellulales bacterium]|nr:DUF3780 domain-containing protein [Pirellulales bacterium]
MTSKTQSNTFAVVARSFGFNPLDSRHHFVVTIPKAATQEVEISEHLTWSERFGSSQVTLGEADDGEIRVVLARPKWNAIADAARAEFNRRLKKIGAAVGSWKEGKNLLRRELGKELVLLAWAIEDADPGLVPNAIANWQGLVPEERWWLCTQTAAATGHGLRDRNKGWRKAVRFALTENPVGMRAGDEPVVPAFFDRALRKTEQKALFGVASAESE